MGRYITTNPKIVEAVQLRWTTWSEMCDFLGDIISPENPARNATGYADSCGEVGPEYIELDVPTISGTVTVRHGEWIIKCPEGLYVCNPHLFRLAYSEYGHDESEAV